MNSSRNTNQVGEIKIMACYEGYEGLFYGIDQIFAMLS